jgi:hypothetical protein
LVLRPLQQLRSFENTLPLFSVERSNKMGGDPNIRYYHSYWRQVGLELRLCISLSSLSDIPNAYRVREGYALLVEATPPKKTVSWNYQLNNHWMESLDYRYYNIHVNKGKAITLPDGRIRIIVASTNPVRQSRQTQHSASSLHVAQHFRPCGARYVRVICADESRRVRVCQGIPNTNWVDTAGHEFGTCCFRWITPYPSSPDMSETEEVSMKDGGEHQPLCRLFESTEELRSHLQA